MFSVESVVDTLKSCRISQTKIKTLGSKSHVFMEEEVNLNEILDECLLLVDPEIACKGIRVKKLFLNNLSKTVQNHFELQKIFLHLLRMSVETSKKNSLLIIETALDDEKISVMIEDAGFHLGVNERLGLADLKSVEFTETNFKTVLQTLEEMGGELFVAFKETRGHIIRVELPAKVSSTEESASNVIDLKKATASLHASRPSARPYVSAKRTENPRFLCLP